MRCLWLALETARHGFCFWMISVPAIFPDLVNIVPGLKSLGMGLVLDVRRVGR